MIRDGVDLTLVATGGILEEAVRAADLLEGRGLSCRVLSVHTVKPLDLAALSAAARQTGGIVVVEEHTVDGGLGGAVAENLLELGAPPAFFLRVGLRSCFASAVGSQHYLRRVYGLDAQSIADAVLARRRGPREVETVEASLSLLSETIRERLAPVA
jgi:transketolase